MRVVPAFDEDSHGRLDLGAETATVEQLACERGEEAFAHRQMLSEVLKPCVAQRASPRRIRSFQSARGVCESQPLEPHDRIYRRLDRYQKAHPIRLARRASAAAPEMKGKALQVDQRQLGAYRTAHDLLHRTVDVANPHGPRARR